VYKENWYVFFGKRKKMKKRFDHDFGGTGLCFTGDDEFPGLCMWIKNKYDWHIIAHEAVHAANKHLRFRGVKGTRKNDEALAYYVSFIIEQIMEAICGEED
jgi:hypothetical protein